MLLLGVAMNYILIDAALALVALVAGFCSALWYVKHSVPAALSEEFDDANAEEQAAKANDNERVDMAAMQLRDLAKNVATDVGAHNTLVTGISDELGKTVDSATVEAAVAKILAANEKLQARLNEAEQKIQAQAEEIRTQQSEAMTDSLTQLANRRAFD